MLFNTLDYAVFLAIVFVGSWALVQPRFSLALPWMALAIYVAKNPSVLGLALSGLGLFITGALIRAAHRESESQAPPRSRYALLQISLQITAVGFLTTREHGLDPFSYALSMLNVPVKHFGPGAWAFTLLGVFGSYLLLVARKVRLLFILGASYVFYAHWDYRFLPLIWGSSTADWWLGLKISKAKGERARRLWLLGTVVLNLGVLGFFKYFNFGIETLSASLSTLGMKAPEVTLRVALPVGISFFTFESMSYVIDVYRRELPPHKSYSEYLSFVAFFPHLVAGPIVRPKDLLPQLAGPGKWNPREISEGLFLIAVGLGKKIVVGDYLALNLIDRVFDAPLMYSALETYAATLAYALQIYCDFSGYTDIAIGSALLLGIRFPLNFNSPYKAHNVIDFWRRWHISLSTWLRDYLYIPLGGNRRGKGRTYFNLLATMVLGGLWHGAAWTFILWGFLHGAALAANRFVQNLRASGTGEQEEKQNEKSTLLRGVSIFLTFHFVCIGWIFFRSETFEKAWLVFAQLATLTTHHANLPLSVVGVLGFGLIAHYIPDKLFTRIQNAFVEAAWPLKGVLLLVVAIALRKMASSDAVPFVYFQF